MRSNRLPFYIVLLLVAAAILFSAAAAQAQSCPELPSEGSWAVTSGETPSVHSDPCSGVHVGNNTLQTIIDFGRQLLFHGVYLNDLDHGMWSIVIRNGTEEALLLENLHTGNNERVYNAFATPVPGTSFEVVNPERDSHGVNLWVIEPTQAPSETPTVVVTETPVPPTEVPTETVTPTEAVETPELTPTPTVEVPAVETILEVVHDVECITDLAAPIDHLDTLTGERLNANQWYEVRNAEKPSQTKIVLLDGHLSNEVLLAWLTDGSVVAIKFESGWADVVHGTGQNNCYRLEPQRTAQPQTTDVVCESCPPAQCLLRVGTYVFANGDIIGLPGISEPVIFSSAEEAEDAGLTFAGVECSLCTNDLVDLHNGLVFVHSSSTAEDIARAINIGEGSPTVNYLDRHLEAGRRAIARFRESGFVPAEYSLAE